MKKLGFVVLGVAALLGCVRKGAGTGNSGENSGLTSVSMRMPTKIGDKEIKLDGYRLSVKKSAGDCSFSDIERSEKVPAGGDVKIDASLKQNCDYKIMLSFGMISADGKKLEKVYLSSHEYEGKPAKATDVNRNDIKGKTQITIKACVNVTALGSKDLGVSPAECSSIADNSVDSTIEPVIPQPAVGPVFKLVEQPTSNYDGFNLSVNANLSSASAKTVYCGVAVKVAISGLDPQLDYTSTEAMEVKMDDKKSIEVKFSGDRFNNSSSIGMADKVITVYEACVESKPSVKVSDLFTKCLAANSCTVIK